MMLCLQRLPHLKRNHVKQQASRFDPLVRASELPLDAKQVLVTAPRQYAEKLCSKLIQAGARPHWIPGVQVAALLNEQFDQLDQALNNLSDFTHIAFTSRNGISAVLQRLEHLCNGRAAAIAHVSASGTRICALGADGELLQDEYGLQVHVSPREASTLGLVRELEAKGEAANATVLCPVPLVTGGLQEPVVVPRFIAALEAARAQPTRVPAYLTTLGCSPESCGAERQLLRDGFYDAIIFSSTAEAQGLLMLMGGKDAIAEAVAVHGLLLAAHGPYTADGCSQVLGLQVPCVSRNFSTFDGVVDALELHYSSLPRG